MQMNQPHSALKDFQNGIFSNDPVEYNAAVNLYVEPNASYSSALISTHGASKIKNILALKRLFVREVVTDKKRTGKDNGEWDEDSQIYSASLLTTVGFPFTIPFIDVSFTFPTTLILHLNVNEDPDIQEVNDNPSPVDGNQTTGEGGVDGERERQYVVTKWEERGPLDTVLSSGGDFVHKLHQSLLRPLTTIILLLLAGAQHFVHTHPLSNGILNFVVAAIVTFLTEARDVILAELSAKHPKMVYHTGNAYEKTKKTGHAVQQSTSTMYTETTSHSRSSSIMSKNSHSTPRFRPTAGSAATTSRSMINATGTTGLGNPGSEAGSGQRTALKDLDEGATSYAGAVADGLRHEHVHPAEVGTESHTGSKGDVGGVPSYAEVVAE